MKPENKRSLPEIELAVIFIAIVFVVQLGILGVVIWNGYQDRRLVEQAQRSSMDYRLLSDQYQLMQKQYTSIKFAMDSISAAMLEINRICQHKSLSNDYSNQLNALKQKIENNRINLSSEASLVKLTYGEATSLLLQKYVADLEKIPEGGATCEKGIYSVANWKAHYDAINGDLNSSLSKVAGALSKMMRK